MILFLKCFFLLCLISSTRSTQPSTPMVTCNELGLSFRLPSGFISLTPSETDALAKRGEKAVKESFDKESLKGWQPVCLNLQDSMKRTVMMNSITEKEAIAQNGSTEEFIARTFKDGNDLIIQRFKDKANIVIDEKEAVEQSYITIADQKVRKNAFTFKLGKQLMFFARYYFFQKNGKLYLLGAFGSPKASNNEDIVQAIEGAKIVLKKQ